MISKNEYKKAQEIHTKAIAMRAKAIDKAKKYEDENAEREKNLLKYNELLEESKKIGREENRFDEALKLLQKAAELMPEKTEARWGVATALHHAGQIEKSLEVYKKLIKDFPDNHRFQFEYGQVLLRNNNLKEGLKEVTSVMKKTEEFDSFLARLGEIYEHIDMIEKALVAYTSYLKKYPHNFEIWTKQGNCLTALGREEDAKKAYKKAQDIMPKNISKNTKNIV